MKHFPIIKKPTQSPLRKKQVPRISNSSSMNPFEYLRTLPHTLRAISWLDLCGNLCIWALFPFFALIFAIYLLYDEIMHQFTGRRRWAQGGFYCGTSNRNAGQCARDRERLGQLEEMAPVPLPERRPRALSSGNSSNSSLHHSNKVDKQLQAALIRKLPIEVREMIYARLFSAAEEDGLLYIYRRTDRRLGCSSIRPARTDGLRDDSGAIAREDMPPPGCEGVVALMQTCRLVYGEVVPLVYEKPRYWFHDLDTLVHFTRTMLPQRLAVMSDVSVSFAVSCEREWYLCSLHSLRLREQKHEICLTVVTRGMVLALTMNSGTRVNMGLRDAIEISPEALSVLSKMGRLMRVRCINETKWLAQSHGLTSEEKLMCLIREKIDERWKDVKIRVEGFEPDQWPERSVSNV